MTNHWSIAGIPLVLGGNVFGWTAHGDDGRAVLVAHGKHEAIVGE